jgi:hypothetical protein
MWTVITTVPFYIRTHDKMCDVCMGRLRNQAQKLEGLGLEVVLLLLDNRLQPGIERLICEARDKVHLVPSLICKYIRLLFRLNSINAIREGENMRKEV